jgi:hypothetical protein
VNPRAVRRAGARAERREIWQRMRGLRLRLQGSSSVLGVRGAVRLQAAQARRLPEPGRRPVPLRRPCAARRSRPRARRRRRSSGRGGGGRDGDGPPAPPAPLPLTPTLTKLEVSRGS